MWLRLLASPRICTTLYFSLAAGMTLQLRAQPCAPTTGQFIYPVNFNMNATLNSGVYTATLAPPTLQVKQGATLLYTHNTPAGFNASYKFYGPGSRYFLVRDVRTSGGLVDIRHYLVNLATPPITERLLLSTTYSTAVTPAPDVQYAQTNAQAVFSDVGTSAPSTINNAQIFCSENGQSICATGPFTPTGQVTAYATASTVQIKTGATIVRECPLPAPSIVVSPTTLNFGTVTTGSVATRTTTVTNSGTATLTYNTTITGANFSNVPTSGTINPTNNQTITVSFAPPTGTAPGAKSGSLSITHNDPAKPSQTVTFNATVATPQPSIIISTASLSFGSVTAGTSVTRTFTITNTGSASLTYGIAATNAMYTASPSVGNVNFPPSPNTVTITVTFSPPAGTPIGLQNGQLNISHNDPSKANPQTITVSANVVQPTPDVCYTNTPVAFGPVNSGSSATRTFTVRNCGTATLNITGLTLTSTPAGVFTISPNIPPTITLNVGVQQTFTVTMTVPAGLTADASYTGSVSFTTNDPTPAGSVNISGTGRAIIPRACVTPTSLGFGDVIAGTSKTLTFRVTNCGGATLNITQIVPTLSPGATWTLAPLAPPTIAIAAPPATNYRDFALTVQIPAGLTVATSYTASYAIQSNDPVTPSVTVSAMATGIPIRIRRFVVRHVTATLSNAQTNDAFQFVVRRAGTPVCTRNFENQPADEREKGRTDNYTLDVTSCLLTLSLVSASDLFYKTLGSNAWLPATMMVTAQLNSGPDVTLVNITAWNSNRWFSRDPNDWPAPRVCREEWALVP